MANVSRMVFKNLKKDLQFWITSVESWISYGVRLSPQETDELLGLIEELKTRIATYRNRLLNN
ncbi:hypothetical protein [Candidatus Caldatribacterium sp.]|uniref:hypothetical protein n=1 Tax=Candidatus Caldatribacterium sp. TaxID=2282143 RepID=UPI00383FC2BE|nr:hypothetical protein [Candidatus Caldatribacterium sp.]